MSTKIQWCDEVWNPTTGCTKGCSYCYARPFAENRLKNNPLTAHQYRNGFTPTCHPDRLEIPLKWKRPRRIFVDSMGDLFDPEIPRMFIQAVFSAMAKARQHTFIVLTKNSERMSDIMSDWTNSGLTLREGYGAQLPNVWLGVSIDTQSSIRRWWDLYYTCTAHRFVSIEPMLEPIRFDCIYCDGKGHYDDNHKTPCPLCRETGQTLDRLEWVIAGPQTGQNKRPYQLEWFYNLREECRAAGVPFFLKGIKNGLEGIQIKEFPA